MNPTKTTQLGQSRSDCAPGNIEALVSIVTNLRLSQFVPGDIIECGSYKCGASIAMAGASPADTVFACDTFGGLPYPGRGFEYFGDVDFEEVLAATSATPNLVPIRGMHEDTIPLLAAAHPYPFKLIFMDSDYYESHVVCLQNLWPRLSPGGVVVFHDWNFPEVQQAISETIPKWETGVRTRGAIPDATNMGWIRKLPTAPGPAMPRMANAAV